MKFHLILSSIYRYKPLIIVCGMASVITWLTMLLVDGVLPLQIVEVVYGTFCATEVAYYSYIYAKTDKKYYQQVTSHTRSAIFFGRLFGSLLAQFLIYFNVADYWQLNLITFVCKSSAILFS
jgi:solute carrier family 19 (thiamine transporter), member 2/3